MSTINQQPLDPMENPTSSTLSIKTQLSTSSTSSIKTYEHQYIPVVEEARQDTVAGSESRDARETSERVVVDCAAAASPREDAASTIDRYDTTQPSVPHTEPTSVAATSSKDEDTGATTTSDSLAHAETNNLTSILINNTTSADDSYSIKTEEENNNIKTVESTGSNKSKKSLKSCGSSKSGVGTIPSKEVMDGIVEGMVESLAVNMMNSKSKSNEEEESVKEEDTSSTADMPLTTTTEATTNDELKAEEKESNIPWGDDTAAVDKKEENKAAMEGGESKSVVVAGIMSILTPSKKKEEDETTPVADEEETTSIKKQEAVNMLNSKCKEEEDSVFGKETVKDAPSSEPLSSTPVNDDLKVEEKESNIPWNDDTPAVDKIDDEEKKEATDKSGVVAGIMSMLTPSKKKEEDETTPVATSTTIKKDTSTEDNNIDSVEIGSSGEVLNEDNQTPVSEQLQTLFSQINFSKKKQIKLVEQYVGREEILISRLTKYLDNKNNKAQEEDSKVKKEVEEEDYSEYQELEKTLSQDEAEYAATASVEIDIQDTVSVLEEKQPSESVEIEPPSFVLKEAQGNKKKLIKSTNSKYTSPKSQGKKKKKSTRFSLRTVVSKTKRKLVGKIKKMKMKKKSSKGAKSSINVVPVSPTSAVNAYDTLFNQGPGRLSSVAEESRSGSPTGVDLEIINGDVIEVGEEGEEEVINEASDTTRSETPGVVVAEDTTLNTEEKEEDAPSFMASMFGLASSPKPEEKAVEEKSVEDKPIEEEKKEDTVPSLGEDATKCIETDGPSSEETAAVDPATIPLPKSDSVSLAVTEEETDNSASTTVSAEDVKFDKSESMSLQEVAEGTVTGVDEEPDTHKLPKEDEFPGPPSFFFKEQGIELHANFKEGSDTRVKSAKPRETTPEEGWTELLDDEVKQSTSFASIKLTQTSKSKKQKNKGKKRNKSPIVEEAVEDAPHELDTPPVDQKEVVDKNTTTPIMSDGSPQPPVRKQRVKTKSTKKLRMGLMKSSPKEDRSATTSPTPTIAVKKDDGKAEYEQAVREYKELQALSVDKRKLAVEQASKNEASEEELAKDEKALKKAKRKEKDFPSKKNKTKRRELQQRISDIESDLELATTELAEMEQEADRVESEALDAKKEAHRLNEKRKMAQAEGRASPMKPNTGRNSPMKLTMSKAKKRDTQKSPFKELLKSPRSRVAQKSPVKKLLKSPRSSSPQANTFEKTVVDNASLDGSENLHSNSYDDDESTNKASYDGNESLQSGHESYVSDYTRESTVITSDRVVDDETTIPTTCNAEDVLDNLILGISGACCIPVVLADTMLCNEYTTAEEEAEKKRMARKLLKKKKKRRSRK